MASPGKQDKPRKLGLGAIILQMRATGKFATKPKKKKNSYQATRVLWKPYMAWIATQPCLVPGCGRPADVAHCGTTGKAMSHKCDNRETLPLCHELHHQEGPQSLHVLGPKFWKVHKLDRQALIAERNLRYKTEIDPKFRPIAA